VPLSLLPDARVVAAGDLPDRTGSVVVSRFWANYSHMAIAAFLVTYWRWRPPFHHERVRPRRPQWRARFADRPFHRLLIAIVFDFVCELFAGRIIDMTGKKLDVCSPPTF